MAAPATRKEVTAHIHQVQITTTISSVSETLEPFFRCSNDSLVVLMDLSHTTADSSCFIMVLASFLLDTFFKPAKT